MTKRTLSVIALGGLLLAGCGGGTTEVERTPVSSTSPMINTPIVSPEPSLPTPSVVESSTPSPIDVSPTPSVFPSPSSTKPTTVTPNPLEPEAEPTTTAATAEEPSTDPPAVPPGGAWVSMEQTVTTAAEAANLTQTSADFRDFVASRVDSPDASGCESEFTILAFHPDGYAAGQESAPGCGGAQNIWGSAGGQWETLMVMQSIVECTEMASKGIPKGLPDIPCLDGNGDVTNW